ncbi:MAG: PKD domain-containing protein [Candidatus Aenigmarchaeota archaeon]
MRRLFANLRVMALVFVITVLLSFSSALALPDSNPVIDSVVIDPENPTRYDDLTCSVDVSDSDGDLDYVDFKWYVNGILTKENTRLVYGSEDSTSDTLGSQYTDANDYVVCQIRVYDFEEAYSFETHAVHVGPTPSNSMPTVSYVDITPRHPNPQQDLTCSVFATDADDNLDYVLFQWERNGNLVRSASKYVEGSSDLAIDTLDSSHTYSGDWIKCKADVYDTYGARDSEDSLLVVIEGEQPRQPGQSEQPGQPPYYPSYSSYSFSNKKPVAVLTANKFYVDRDETVLFSGVGSSDSDGYVLQYKFDYGDGEQSAWLPSETYYTYHAYDMEGTYQARVKVKDDEYLESDWSNPVMIRVNGYDRYGYGDDPEIDDIDIFIDDYNSYVNFECWIDTFDRNGDLEYVKFKWYLNGELFTTEKISVSGRSDEAISAINLKVDEHYTLECKATVYDEEHNSDQASNSVSGQFIAGEEEGCKISVNRFDYYSYLRKVDKGWVEMEVENTGERSGTLTMELYVDDSLKDEYKKYISAGEKAEKRFEFPISVGTHKVRVESYLPCSEHVTKFTEMTLFPVSPRVFVPEEEEKEPEITTSVTISSTSLDIEANSGKTLEVIIESPEPAKFNISVEGLPENWVNYPGEIEVDGRETIYMYIVPKDVGNYEFTVKVKTGSETFEKDIGLYVAPAGEEGEEGMNGITGLISFTEGNWVIGLGAVSVIVLLTALYFVAGRRFKRKTYEEHVYGSESPRNYPIYGEEFQK